MKHTAGPWKIDKVWGLVKGPQGQEVCAIHAADAPGVRTTRATAQANAQLIVTAPELLKALTGLLERYQCDCKERYAADNSCAVCIGYRAKERAEKEN